jgi:hypothetical protein
VKWSTKEGQSPCLFRVDPGDLGRRSILTGNGVESIFPGDCPVTCMSCVKNNVVRPRRDEIALGALVVRARSGASPLAVVASRCSTGAWLGNSHGLEQGGKPVSRRSYRADESGTNAGR